MGLGIRRRRLICIWVPIALLATMLGGSAFIVLRVAEGWFACPSPEWQQSARAEMEAITPTDTRSNIFLSDCDDNRAVSYKSDPGDPIAIGDTIVHLADSRGWQPVGADGSRRCRSKELEGRVSYLKVGNGQYSGGPFASATIVTDATWCADRILDALVPD